MNDYKRFVSYIYNYEMKIKKNNVGFARVEIKDNQCKISIHMQVKTISNASIRLYGFSRKEVDFIAIPLGDIMFKNGSGDGKILTSVQNLGDFDVSFDKIGGLILYLSDDKYFGTEWDDKPLIFKEFHIMEEQREEEELKLRTTEVALDDQNANEDKSIELFEVAAVFEPYTLLEILEQYHYAVTEDFMLHGYHRFGHLGVMKKKDKCVLGVPGIFCKREEVIANRKGFNNFYPKNGGVLNYGDFGYWYTNIEYLK
ncbi:MAG: hypothetical protein ACERKN_04275 [Velocimicrobium sp.]